MKLPVHARALGKQITLITTAFILAVSTLTAAVPFILSQNASAAPEAVFTQGFEANTNGVLDKDNGSASYGDIERVPSGTGGITAAGGSSYATVSQTDSGPFTRFDGYRSTWSGEWRSSVAVYLDPSWTDGTGFDWSVAANSASNTHRRDFVFHVEKDASTGSLLVAGSNNTGFAPRTNLESGAHYTVATAGWYTLQHVFRDNGGVLAVDLNVLDAAGNVLFTTTRSDATDLVSLLGANRYGWFTYVSVPGTLAIDNLNLAVTALPVKNVSTNESFTSIKQAIDDSDTVNGNVIEVSKNITVTEAAVVNKDVTIRGVNGAVLSTSGSNQLFTVLANGVTFEGLTFQKTDNADQHFIGVQSSGVTIADNSFTAQYNLTANAGTTRAIVVSGGVDALVITGNTFNNIRQPAYINNGSTGTISANYANQTRGWVIEKASNFELIGNTWGTNAIDFAIIPGVNPSTTPNNYTCKVATIISANSNARVDDQAPASILTCPNTAPLVSFTGATPADGSWVRGTVNGSVLATDDHGMGSYYVRYWKNAFEIAGGGSLVGNCQSAPGAFLLGKSVTANCSYDTTAQTDGTKLVLSAQFLDGHNAWGSNLRTYYVDNTKPTISVKTGTSTVDGSSTTQPYTYISFKLYDKAGNLKEVVLNGNTYTRSGTWNDLNWLNITKSQLLQGTNTIIVRDKAGNESQLTFEYDSVAPDAPVLGVNGLVSGGATNQSSVTAIWNKPSSDVVRYEYKYWNEIPASPWNASNPWTTSVTGESRTGDFTEGEGKHFLQVRAFDGAGHVSPWSNVFEINYDATAPNLSIPTYTITGNVIRPDITNDDPSASLKWDRVSSPTGSVVTISDDTALAPDFTVDTTGRYEYTITATDPAGNLSVQTLIFNYAAPAAAPVTNEGEVLSATDGEEQPQTVTNPAATPQIVGPTGFASILGTSTNNQDDTDDTNGTAEVEGLETANTLAAAVDADNTDGNALGLAWYWWLLIIAGGATGLWWLIAALRGRGSE